MTDGKKNALDNEMPCYLALKSRRLGFEDDGGQWIKRNLLPFLQNSQSDEDFSDPEKNLVCTAGKQTIETGHRKH